MTPKPINPELAIEHVRQDYQQATRAGLYRVSRNAFYFPGFPATWYIPCRALTSAAVCYSTVPTSGCCRRELPVIKLTLHWEEGIRELVVDPPRHTETLLQCLRAARPDLPVEDGRF